AADRLKALGQSYGAGCYFSPPRKTEYLMSNLLRITTMPARIWRAETNYRTWKEMNEALRKIVEWAPTEYIFKDNLVYTPHNLREPPWPDVCEKETVEADDITDWSESNDQNRQREFVW